MKPEHLAGFLGAVLCATPGCTSTFGCKGGSTTRVEETEVSAEDYEAVLDEDGALSDEACAQLCEDQWGRTSDACELVTETDEGGAVLECTMTFPVVCEGRRTAGLRVPSPPVGSSIGAWLARAATMEAASVEAFLRLGRELRAHGAPLALERAAVRAAADEVRHARMMGALAHAHGSSPLPLAVPGLPMRPLRSMATENAVEGCVHETWAALIAMHQARAAADAPLRRTMAAIARDEVRHARLAWEVDAWARSRVDSTTRTYLTTVRRDAGARGPAGFPSAPELGLPQRAAGLAMHTAMQPLWNGALGVA